MFSIIQVTASASDMGEDLLSNRQFLEFEEAEQYWFYIGAFYSLGHIAKQTNSEEVAVCTWNWLKIDPPKKKSLLIGSFKDFPDHSPTGVILSYLQRDCGLDLNPKK